MSLFLEFVAIFFFLTYIGADKVILGFVEKVNSLPVYYSYLVWFGLSALFLFFIRWAFSQ